MNKFLNIGKTILYFSLFLSLTMVSCKKDDVNGGNDDDKGGGSISDKTIELACADFSDGELKLTNSSAAVDYIVNCNSNVTAKVTVEPGTVIAFGPNASLNFTTGTLKAVGTSDEPIIFRGGEEQVSGYWRGIRVNSNSNDNQLSHVIIRHTGSDNSVSLSLENGRISLSDVTVEKGEADGIRISNKVNIGNFSRIKVTSHKGYPLSIAASQLNIIDGESSDFTGNDIDMAYVMVESVTNSLTVQKINIPYYIDRTWGLEAEIAFDAGTQFTFATDAGIRVYNSGSLAMNGQNSDPILLAGEIDEAGSWKGVYYENSISSKNVMKNVNITGAGSGYVVCCRDPASLTVNGVISMNNVNLRNGAGLGIDFRSSAKINEFTDVSVTSHQKEPIRLNMVQATELYGENSDFTGNTSDYVYLNSSDVDVPAKLHKLNVPYYLDGAYVSVNSSLDIDPGVKILFGNDGGLYVNNGTITAKGTSSDMITFDGFVDAKGTWKGIEVHSVNPKNELRYVTINNAGHSYVRCCSTAALKIGKSAILKIDHATISNTKGCALRYDHDSSTLTLDNISFVNNDEDECDI